MYTVRAATNADLPSILALAETSAQVTGVPPLPPREVGPALLARTALWRMVAMHAGQIVGHAMLEQPNPEHMAVWAPAAGPELIVEVGGLFTCPDHSRSGIATLLLGELLHVCAEHHWTPVTASWTHNRAAQHAALARAGATRVGSTSTPQGEVDLHVFTGGSCGGGTGRSREGGYRSGAPEPLA